ncbi:MAG: hypothetical protein WEG56_14220 [Chloroflexota bacterium]
MTPPPGLCATCRHVRVVTTARGSRFILCRRSVADPRFPRYPALPVLRCPGFQPPDAAAPDEPPPRA